MIIHSAAHLCAFAHGPQLIFFIIFFRVRTIPAYVKVRSDYQDPSDTEYTFLQQQKRMKKREIFYYTREAMDG